MNEPFLTSRLADFLSWRNGLNRTVHQTRNALERLDVLDEGASADLDRLLYRVESDRLSIAFVSEAERGKSELINALFFSERRRRLLPSGPGRSTLCATELHHDPDEPVGIRLLPIETRESDASFAELRADDSAWRFIPFIYEDFDSIQRALVALSETRRVTLAEAVAWGLHADATSRAAAGGVSLMDVPRWRHAVINMPHPVLQAGLVVIDTPGLSALAAEPELSRKRLPQCDCVVFVMDSTQGLTKPDLTLWRDYLGGKPTYGRAPEAPPQSRLVAVNKIDTLYDSAASDTDALREIDKVVKDVADLLRVDPMCVIPLSARLGYIGKTAGDKDKLIKSRLYQIERAITRELSDGRQVSMTAEARRILSAQIDAARARLDEERYELLAMLRHMGELRERNQKLIGNLMGQASSHLDRYESALKEVRMLRQFHARLTEELAAVTDRDRARFDADRTADELSAALLPGAVEEMAETYLDACRARIRHIEIKVAEIKKVYEDASAKLAREQGMPPVEMLPFSTQRFMTELQKAETELKATSALLLKRGAALGQHFHETCGARVCHIFEIAAREGNLWMRGMLAELDRAFERLKDSSLQRAQGTEKLRMADIDLAEKISELQARLDAVRSRREALSELDASLVRQLAETQAESA
ncbi:MAG: dynamin family protein [Betaproteobacteria bacterium]|nr:dynamin family protein [Betaproteobacteria bacterium]